MPIFFIGLQRLIKILHLKNKLQWEVEKKQKMGTFVLGPGKEWIFGTR